MNEGQLTDRAIIRLSGEDVRGFLQGLVTNDVLGPLPVWAGLLTPQGKALFDFLIFADGPDLLIDCEADVAAALTKKLTLYRLRRPISIALDPALAVYWSQTTPSDGAKRHAADLGPRPWEPVFDPRDPALGYRWIVPLGGPLAEGYHQHRLGLGIVEGVAELGQESTLWLEARAREQNGVSFTKGCYVGQENTARMHHRGKVNKMLAVVPFLEAEAATYRVAYPEFGLAVVRKAIAG